MWSWRSPFEVPSSPSSVVFEGGDNSGGFGPVTVFRPKRVGTRSGGPEERGLRRRRSGLHLRRDRPRDLGGRRGGDGARRHQHRRSSGVEAPQGPPAQHLVRPRPTGPPLLLHDQRQRDVDAGLFGELRHLPLRRAQRRPHLELHPRRSPDPVVGGEDLAHRPGPLGRRSGDRRRRRSDDHHRLDGGQRRQRHRPRHRSLHRPIPGGGRPPQRLDRP
jgi:hypothetical protein